MLITHGGDLHERREEGVAKILHGGNGSRGAILILGADLEVERLDGLVELLRLRPVAALLIDEVVDVEAHRVELTTELHTGLGPVRLLHVLRDVLVDAVEGLGRARLRLVGVQLLEGEAGRAVQTRALRDVQVARLVDELEALLVSDALVLELDLVERERGHRGERDDTGDGEGDSLSMFKRGWSGRVSQVVLASIRSWLDRRFGAGFFLPRHPPRDAPRARGANENDARAGGSEVRTRLRRRAIAVAVVS